MPSYTNRSHATNAREAGTTSLGGRLDSLLARCVKHMERENNNLKIFCQLANL